MFNVTQVAAYQRSDGEPQLPFSHIKTFTKEQTFRPPEILTQIPKVPMQNEKLSPIVKPFTEDLFKKTRNK